MGPHSSDPTVGNPLSDNTPINIVCQTNGDTVTDAGNGAQSAVWDMIGNSQYITDLYASTSSTTGGFDPNLSKCGSGSPGPQPPPHPTCSWHPANNAHASGRMKGYLTPLYELKAVDEPAESGCPADRRRLRGRPGSQPTYRANADETAVVMPPLRRWSASTWLTCHRLCPTTSACPWLVTAPGSGCAPRRASDAGRCRDAEPPMTSTQAARNSGGLAAIARWCRGSGAEPPTGLLRLDQRISLPDRWQQVSGSSFFRFLL
jgi:hypothetical protein